MPHFQLPTLVLSLVLLPGPSPVHAQSEGRVMMGWVRSIEGRSPQGRKTFITSQLDSLGVAYSLMPFDTVLAQHGRAHVLQGENIIVRLGSGDPTVVVGTHSDAVANSPGANDNGGGVAVVLMLIATLRTHRWNQTVDFAFFDQEEPGLIGSAVYVARAVDRKRHRAMINLDVVGTGEVIYVGPVGGGDDDRVMRSVRSAGRTYGLPLDERERYPGSDHLSFARAGLENISVSIAPKGAVEYLDAMLKGTDKGRDPTPDYLAVMHTPKDSSTRMSAGALDLAYALVKGTLLDLDAPAR